MEHLPSDIHFQTIKFTRQPIAEIFMDATADISYLDDSGCCIHGISLAFPWFHEKQEYEQQDAIRERNLPKEVEQKLFRATQRTWDLYIMVNRLCISGYMMIQETEFE